MTLQWQSRAILAFVKEGKSIHQIADEFAVSSQSASYVRSRVNKLISYGLLKEVNGKYYTV